MDPAPLRPLSEVQEHVLGAVRRLPRVDVPLADALGLATAAEITSPIPVPPFANSAMDGFAVRRRDTQDATAADPVRLRVVGEVAAGAVGDRPVGEGEAIRIMTGAVVPEGCDGIVIVEDTSPDGDHVVVRAPAGDHIRPAGGDVDAGDVVFGEGTELGPAHLGVIASIGIASVPVGRRPRVGVLSTGDELVAPGEPLGPGKIYESNRPMLLALAAEAACEPVDLGTVSDDEEVLADVLRSASRDCDALLTSGGVSMGEYDVVKAVLDRVGEMAWFQVAIKPAKPFAFGLLGEDRTPVFGLPGNPVSSLVSFELFARPALRAMMGQSVPHRPVVTCVAAAAFSRRRDGKTHFDRVRVAGQADGHLLVERSGVQSSNVLTAMARADGLAIVPDGDGVAEGAHLDVMLLGPPRTLGT